MNRVTSFIAGACLLVVGVAAPVSAGGVDVDFDGLKANLRITGDDWLLQFSYEIEVNDAPTSEAFTLALDVFEHGRPLVDADNKPVQILVPLDRPVDGDEDEQEYEGTLEVTLPAGSVRDADGLKLVGRVIRERDGRVFEKRDTSVRFDRPVVHVREVVTPVVFEPTPVVVERRIAAPVIVERRYVRAPVYVTPARVHHVRYVDSCPPRRVVRVRW
ncbi:MAG: hypothetical protein AB7Q17_07380 [Phycisphaerae bacterium]